MADRPDLEYVGFWPRLGATIIDTLLLCLLTWPIGMAVYGRSYWTSTSLLKGPADLLISWVFPAVAIILYWIYKQATPGKMAISALIVDDVTGDKPSVGQLIGRYFAYFISTLPFGLGFFWVAFDSKKQGWHDKLAGTVVVRPKNRQPAAVSFE